MFIPLHPRLYRNEQTYPCLPRTVRQLGLESLARHVHPRLCRNEQIHPSLPRTVRQFGLESSARHVRE